MSTAPIGQPATPKSLADELQAHLDAAPLIVSREKINEYIESAGEFRTSLAPNIRASIAKAIVALLATIDFRDAEIARLAKIEERAKAQYHAASQADNKDPFAGRVMTELRRVLGNETPEKPGFCEDIAIAAMSNTVTSQQAEIERQGKALSAVEALAAKLSREDRFAYASDIYDALERDD